jgi:hypothetical protein
MLINCLQDLDCYKIMGPSDKKRKINLIIGQNKNVMLSNKIQTKFNGDLGNFELIVRVKTKIKLREKVYVTFG